MLPCLTVTELGVAEIAKSGLATTKVALAVWVFPDVLVAVMVRV